MNLGPFAFEEISSGLASSATHSSSSCRIEDKKSFDKWNPSRWVYRLKHTEDLLHENVKIKDEVRLEYWRSYSSFSARLGIAREGAIVGGIATPFQYKRKPHRKRTLIRSLCASLGSRNISVRSSSTSGPDDGKNASLTDRDGNPSDEPKVSHSLGKQKRCPRKGVEIHLEGPMGTPSWLSRRPADYSSWRVDLYLRSSVDDPNILVSVGPYYYPYGSELGALSGMVPIATSSSCLSICSNLGIADSEGIDEAHRKKKCHNSTNTSDSVIYPPPQGQHPSPCPIQLFSPLPPTPEERRYFDKKMLYTPLIWEEPFTVSVEVTAGGLSLWSEQWEVYSKRLSDVGMQKVSPLPSRSPYTTESFPPPCSTSIPEDTVSVVFTPSPSPAFTIDGSTDSLQSSLKKRKSATKPSARGDLWGVFHDEPPFATSLALAEESPLYEMYLRMEFRRRPHSGITRNQDEVEIELSSGTLLPSKRKRMPKKWRKRHHTRGSSQKSPSHSNPTRTSSFVVLSSPCVASSDEKKVLSSIEVKKEEKKGEEKEGTRTKRVPATSSSSTSTTCHSSTLHLSASTSTSSSFSSFAINDTSKEWSSSCGEETFTPLITPKVVDTLDVPSPFPSPLPQKIAVFSGDLGETNVDHTKPSPFPACGACTNEQESPTKNHDILPSSSFSTSSPPLHPVVENGRENVKHVPNDQDQASENPLKSTASHPTTPSKKKGLRTPRVEWKKISTTTPLRLLLPREASPLVFCPYVTLMASGDGAAVIGGSCGCVEGDTRCRLPKQCT